MKSQSPSGKRAPRLSKKLSAACDLDMSSFVENVDCILCCIAVESRNRLRFQMVNQAFLDASGLRRGRIVGKLVQEVIPVITCSGVLKNCQRAIRTRKTVRWEEVSPDSSGRRYGEITITPHLNKAGRVTHLLVSIHDVTVRKQAEVAVMRQANILRDALEKAPFEFWMRDLSGVCILQNQAVKAHWGDLLGKRPEDADIPASDLKIWLENNRRAASGEMVVEEVSFQHGGQTHWMQNVIAPFGDGDVIQGIFGFNIDITKRKQAEIALRESEARYARAVRGTNEGLWEWNMVSGKTYLSPRWKELLGFADDELPNDREKGFYARLHPDDLAVVEAARRENLARLVPYSVEVRLRMKSGDYRWFHIRGQAEGDALGKPILMAGAMSDINDRKQTEQALRQSEERFRAVFEQAAMAVGIIDIATDRFLEVNQQYCNITGRTREEMLAGSFIEMTHPDDLRANLRLHERLKAGKIKEHTIEKRYIRPDGSITWGYVHATRIATKDGSPDRLLSIVEDITKRKKSEENYQREVSFNETLVNHTSAIIVLLDHVGRMIYVNDATLKMLGYKRKELINHTPWEVGVMDAGEALRSKERLVRVLKGQENPPREVILWGKDGTPHHVELSSTATRAPDGTADRIIVTGTDLTERHHLQKEILRISEQEQARIGHNLHDGVGQTMTGIASLMAGLESDLKGGSRAQALRIGKLIQDAILEVRQMSHGLSPMAVQNRGLDGALKLLAETIRINHRIACKLEMDTAIRLGDVEKETHIYRIAQEAANNAIRHGHPQNISLSLLIQGEHECVLKIEDDGTGMKKSKTDNGHGIGTRVMEYRAKCIGGTLEVKTRRGHGVSVVCRFPYEPRQIASKSEKQS